MKKSTFAFLLIVSVLAAGYAMPGCGGKPVCSEFCNKADICLSELGIPIQDVYDNCLLPCAVQNPAWKSCVLSCDTDAPCVQYAVCLLYCGYWQ